MAPAIDHAESFCRWTILIITRLPARRKAVKRTARGKVPAGKPAGDDGQKILSDHATHGSGAEGGKCSAHPVTGKNP